MSAPNDPALCRPPAYATIAVILSCAWVFVWQLSLGDGAARAYYALGLMPAVLTGQTRLVPELALLPPPVTLVSSLLLHTDLAQCGGNLLYLWIFGTRVENAMGALRFVAFVCICGIFAGLAELVIAPASVVPIIGAGGMVSGAIGAYLLLHPRLAAPLTLALTWRRQPLRAPLGVILAVWALLQFIAAARYTDAAAGIAWPAHLAGIVIGGILILLLKHRDVALFDSRPAGESRLGS